MDANAETELVLWSAVVAGSKPASQRLLRQAVRPVITRPGREGLRRYLHEDSVSVPVIASTQIQARKSDVLHAAVGCRARTSASALEIAGTPCTPRSQQCGNGVPI